LQRAGVFDSVSHNETATIEESRQKKTDSAEGADEAQVEENQ